LKNVVILDPKGVISKGGDQTLNRHIQYADRLATATGGAFRLVVVTRTENQAEDLSFKNLRVIYLRLIRPNYLSFFVLAMKSLKRKDIEILVVGDPWSPFFVAFAMRILLNWQIPIQVQLHADLFSSEWLEGGPTNKAKAFLAIPAMFVCDSIRFVSKGQLSNSVEKHRWVETKSFVSPVSLHLETSVPTRIERSNSNSITLGLLGRIHKDRGLDLLVPLIAPVIKLHPEIQLKIAGEGPYQAELETQIKSAGLSENITFVGHIGELELPRFWLEIDILISLAPSESYGRSIREALVAGVPVWANSSSGVKELQEIAKNSEISLIDFSISPLAQFSLIERMALTTVTDETREEVACENEQGLQALINSWVNRGRNKFERGN
jgi:glycosyltransferase involved in cell wall biosynthesis